MQNEQRRDDILRELLKNEFQKRAQKNPSFSLRAFSQKLDIDQSLLSKILQGKRKFSDENAKKISQFLGIYLEKLSQGKNPSFKTNYDLLKEDQFLLISAWYHFALLELIKTKGFHNSPSYISSKLGISEADAKMSVDRLKRLGFVAEKNKKLKLTKSSNTWVDLEKTNAARKSLQKVMQEKSLNALEDFSFDEREHSSLTVAIDPKHLPEIKKKITEFRRSLDLWIEEKGNPKEVYNLCVSFFPLTKKEKK
jgi:uncharacterized protein (TIGR02147 family)